MFDLRDTAAGSVGLPLFARIISKTIASSEVLVRAAFDGTPPANHLFVAEGEMSTCLPAATEAFQ